MVVAFVDHDEPSSLVGSGRGDEHAVVMREDRRDRGLLLQLQRPVELERERLGCRAPERAEVEHRMGPNGRTLEYRLTTAGRDL